MCALLHLVPSTVAMMNFVYFELTVDEAVLALSPNPLEMVCNLRDQANGQIKQENLFEPNLVKGGFISWEDVQRTRLSAVETLNTLPESATATQRKTAMQQAALISLMSLIPPDRVGVVRKLRLSHTLVRRESGGWRIDLTKRGSHKTSKHFGPFSAKLPSQLDEVLDRYTSALETEGPGGDEAYLFSPRTATDRPLETSAFTMAVKRAFKKHSPAKQEVSPKVLRSSFIVWLRDSTTAPEVLKAAAHAQKQCAPHAPAS